MSLNDDKLQKLHASLKTWRPGTVFFVIALDPEDGQRTWFSTAGGPWNDELRQTANEYEHLVPLDCRTVAFPPDRKGTN